MLQLDREQRETYVRSAGGLHRPTRQVPRVLVSSTLGGVGQARNKQKMTKRTVFEVIGGGAITCPQFEAYIKNAFSSHSSVPIGGDQMSRTFPTTPERVLDAPGLIDDFYLNVFDWSKRNRLAVALGPSVYLWDGRTGSVSELMTLPSVNAYVTSLRWIHDGSSIAIGNSEGTVQIWDGETVKKLRTIIGSSNGQRLASLAWNKHLLTTGSRGGQIWTNDVRQPKPLILQHQSFHEANEVCGLEWSPDGMQLASGGNDNLVHIWDANIATPRYVFNEHKSAVKAISWCPWKQGLLATGGGSQDKQIRIWNSITGDCVSNSHAESQVTALVWSKTSKELLSAHGMPDNKIQVWKVASTSQSVCHLSKSTQLDQAHSSRVLHMTLSPDGQTVVTAGADETIKFWKAFEPADDRVPFAGKKPVDVHKGYVLMPKFSRSNAINRAMHNANRLIM